MPYEANGDYTAERFTVDGKNNDEYTITVTGCSDADGNAAVELYIDDVLIKELVWNSASTKDVSCVVNLGNTSVHTVKLLLVNDYGQSDLYLDKVKITAPKSKINFISPSADMTLYTDSVFEVSWEATSNLSDSYILSWVDDKTSDITVLKENVSATDSYRATIPAFFDGASGYYTISSKTQELIPSDFDGKSYSVTNPLIWADVPDVAVVRVNDTYYMVSTTMHMTPGAPIMASKDLVRWRTINYAHPSVENGNDLSLECSDAYGKASWAPRSSSTHA